MARCIIWLLFAVWFVCVALGFMSIHFTDFFEFCMKYARSCENCFGDNDVSKFNPIEAFGKQKNSNQSPVAKCCRCIS